MMKYDDDEFTYCYAVNLVPLCPEFVQNFTIVQYTCILAC